MYFCLSKLTSLSVKLTVLAPVCIPVSIPSPPIFCHSLFTKMSCYTRPVTNSFVTFPRTLLDHNKECKSGYNSPQIPHKCRILLLFSFRRHHKMQLPGKQKQNVSTAAFHLECICEQCCRHGSGHRSRAKHPVPPLELKHLLNPFLVYLKELGKFCTVYEHNLYMRTGSQPLIA